MSDTMVETVVPASELQATGDDYIGSAMVAGIMSGELRVHVTLWPQYGGTTYRTYPHTQPVAITRRVWS